MKWLLAKNVETLSPIKGIHAAFDLAIPQQGRQSVFAPAHILPAERAKDIMADESWGERHTPRNGRVPMALPVAGIPHQCPG